MHPEYPCAHCIVASAVSNVLQSVVGNEVGEITLTSPTAPGITRKWTRLQEYSDEVSDARVYAGFHYRFSTEAGKDMGKNTQCGRQLTDVKWSYLGIQCGATLPSSASNDAKGDKAKEKAG